MLVAGYIYAFRDEVKRHELIYDMLEGKPRLNGRGGVIQDVQACVR